jgi:hypothetical protein
LQRRSCEAGSGLKKTNGKAPLRPDGKVGPGEGKVQDPIGGF